MLYQRYEFGTLANVSALTTQGPGAFGPAPDFQALNSDSDVNLRIRNLPANVDIGRGDLLYVTEVFTRHPWITPLNRFGVAVPTTLYSIAYF